MGNSVSHVSNQALQLTDKLLPDQLGYIAFDRSYEDRIKFLLKTIKDFRESVHLDRRNRFALDQIDISSGSNLATSVKNQLKLLKTVISEETIRELNVDYTSALERREKLPQLDKWIFWNFLESLVSFKIMVPLWMAKGYGALKTRLNKPEITQALLDISSVKVAEIITSFELAFYFTARFLMSRQLGDRPEHIVAILSSIMGIISGYRTKEEYNRAHEKGLECLLNFVSKNPLGNLIDRTVIEEFTKTTTGVPNPEEKKNLLLKLSEVCRGEPEISKAFSYMALSGAKGEDSVYKRYKMSIIQFLATSGAETRFESISY